MDSQYVSWMSRVSGREFAVVTRDCGVSMTSQASNVCEHRLPAIPIENKRRQ